MHCEQSFRSSCIFFTVKVGKIIKILLVRIPFLSEPKLCIYVDRCQNLGNTPTLCLPERGVSRQGEHNTERKILEKVLRRLFKAKYSILKIEALCRIKTSVFLSVIT